MPTKNPSMHDIFERNKYNISSLKKSKTWFQQQVAFLQKQNITPHSVMRSGESTLKVNIIPGNCYFFYYDPKYKLTLPYYDMFPLVFPYAKVPGGFMGLNMHYLSYPMRIKLLDNLLIFKNNNKMDETTRLKYNWSLLSNVAKFAPAQACVKHYLDDHVKSPFKQIDCKYWATAMMLPVEMFRGANKNQVWKDSQGKI